MAPPDNDPPVINTGGPYSSLIGQAVAFNASGSYDPDGRIVFYRWNFGDNSSEILDIDPTHIYSVAGTYTVTLTIVDNDGRSKTETTTATITASAVVNVPPVAGLGGPYTSEENEVITLDGSASFDVDGQIDGTGSRAGA